MQLLCAIHQWLFEKQNSPLSHNCAIILQSPRNQDICFFTFELPKSINMFSKPQWVDNSV